MWARWCWYLGHDNRPCPSSSREPWSVPRLRGRGKQGEIARKAHLCPRSMTSTRGSLSSTYVLNTRKSADRTLGLPRVYLCSPRPRKRGTLHICANLSSFRDSRLSGLRGNYPSIATNRLAAELRFGSTISGTGANGKSWAPGREIKAARQPAHIAPATSHP